MNPNCASEKRHILAFHNAELESLDAGTTFVGLSYPCKREYIYEFTQPELVCEHTTPHGHIIIFCLDEACVVPAAIESQPMLSSVLASLVQQTQLTKDEMRCILAQTASRKLATHLTPREKKILSDQSSFAAFCSLGDFYRF